MKCQATPEYFEVLNRQVKPCYLEEVASRTLERVSGIPDLDAEQRLAVHLLLGQYEERTGATSEPGTPLLPEQLASRGLYLTAKKRDQVVQTVNEQIDITAQSHHFLPEFREVGGAKIVGTSECDPSDSLGVYLARLRHLPSHKEVNNQRLTATIQVGKAAKAKMSNLQELGDATGQFEELEEQIRLGDLARNQFVEANLSLAFHFAKKYTPRQGMDFDDVVQICNLALLAAAKNFVPIANGKLSPYYEHYVQAEYVDALRKDYDPIPIPTEQRQRKEAYLEFVKSHRAKHDGAEPSFGEALAHLNLKPEKRTVETLQAALAMRNLVSLRDTAEMNMLPTPEEYETDETTEIPAVNNESLTLIIDNVCEIIEQRELSRKVRELLKEGLTEKERYIIEQRFGIGAAVVNAVGEVDYLPLEPRTLDSIGQDVGLTRESIRRIESQIFSKLRLRYHHELCALESFIRETNEGPPLNYVAVASDWYLQKSTNKPFTVGHNPFMAPGHDE